MLVKIRSSNLWAHVSGDSRNTTCHFRGDFQGYLSFGDCWSSSCTCLELSRPGLVLPDLLHSLDNDAWIVDDFGGKPLFSDRNVTTSGLAEFYIYIYTCIYRSFGSTFCKCLFGRFEFPSILGMFAGPENLSCLMDGA